jgi:DNA-binding Lrp family transcriptional regulator
MKHIVYALVETEYKPKKKAHEALYKKLFNLDNVVEVYTIHGNMRKDFDFLIKFETKNPQIVGDTIVNKIRTLDGVVDTESYLCVSWIYTILQK